MIRVLYLSNSPKLGGANRYLQVLFENLPASEVEPAVVGPDEGQMARECRAAGIGFDLIPYRQPSWSQPFTSFHGLIDWIKVLRKIRPDLIHANDFMNSRSIAVAAAALSMPVICHVHFPLEPVTLEWMFRMLPRPAAFVYNSHSTREVVDGVLCRACPRAKRSVIHNCVKVEEFVRPTSGATSRVPKVAIVANLLRVKGHIDFLQMAQSLARRGTEAEFWIIGGETVELGYEDELKKLCAEMGLDHCVRFLGHRSDVSQLLSQVAVSVCASHVEPFGICNLEAMERGLPVVGTLAGGIPEVVVDGSTGYLVPPGRPGLLADKVAQLLSDPDLRQQLGNAGRERVLEEFNARRHASQIQEFYLELLK